MSGRLVKTIDGEVFIAHERVAGPGFIIYVGSSASSNGWTFYADPVDHESFAVHWKKPTGAHDAYPLGAMVSHSGSVWRSMLPANVFEPGVHGWRPMSNEVEIWQQPTGAHDAYQTGAVVAHNGKMWRSTIDANVWAPGVSGWRETALMLPSGEPVIPAWVRPTGGHDAYAKDAVVRHNGNTWKSTVNANVWEPGVYGWIAI